MKAVLKRFSFVASGVLSLLALTACVSALPRCPYIIEDATVCVEPSAWYALAGLQLQLANTAAKPLQSCTLVLELCTAEGGESVWSEPYVIVWEPAVDANDSALCRLSLDAFFAEAPTEPLVVANVFLRAIRYSDGSRWSDPFGLYASAE